MIDQAFPSLDQQTTCWDKWDMESRTKDWLDRYMLTQLTAAETYLPNGLTLEVGCGTGWMSAGLCTPKRPMMGIDLGPNAIAYAQRRYPQVTFLQGDFVALPPVTTVENVVSADCLAHVGDQQAFMNRVADWMRPGGTFVLLTQNGYIWSRSSNLPAMMPGQIRRWRTVEELRGLLAKDFTVEYITAVAPGGDRGWLRLVNNRPAKALVRGIMGKRRRDRLYDHYLGKELVVVARRR